MRPGKNAVLVIVLAAAVALMLVYVWEGWRGRMLVAELDRLQTEQRRLFDEKDRLRAQIVALSRVERIKEIAANEIGLVDPALPPVEVPAIAPLGPPDSLEATRATGLERYPGR